MRRTLFVVMLAVASVIPVLTNAWTRGDYSLPDDIVRLYGKGDYDAARERIRSFRRQYPDNPLAIFYLARMESDIDAALALYREVERLADSTLAAEALFTQAEILYDTDNISGAGELYERLITDYGRTPFFAEALYRLGIIRLLDGETAKALVHFDICLEQDVPEDLRILVRAGVMEARAADRDWEGALVAARTVLEESDDYNGLTPRVLEVIATAFRERGDIETARGYIERLLGDYPESYQAHAIRERGASASGGIFLDAALALTDSLPDEDSLSAGAADAGNDGSDAISRDDGTCTVQAAAFVDKNNAMRLYSKLKTAGYPARLAVKSIGEKHFYLVQVGMYRSRGEAEQEAERVSGFTGTRATVVTLD